MHAVTIALCVAREQNMNNPYGVRKNEYEKKRVLSDSLNFNTVDGIESPAYQTNAGLLTKIASVFSYKVWSVTRAQTRH